MEIGGNTTARCPRSSLRLDEPGLQLGRQLTHRAASVETRSVAELALQIRICGGAFVTAVNQHKGVSVCPVLSFPGAN